MVFQAKDLDIIFTEEIMFSEIKNNGTKHSIKRQSKSSILLKLSHLVFTFQRLPNHLLDGINGHGSVASAPSHSLNADVS